MEKTTAGRKDVTRTLTRAAVYYLSRKMYSCHVEFGIERWGRRRLDIIALNTKGQMIGIEVKSCAADYRNDDKWHVYLPYVNKLYMVFSEALYSNAKFMRSIWPELKERGVGIMVLSETTGYVQVKKAARQREVDPDTRNSMLLRMAWRGGESRRTIKRRQRLYLTR